VAVPKNRLAALAYVTEFVEEAKASGLVRRAFDAVGLSGSVVARRYESVIGRLRGAIPRAPA
jgi:hypothetical protein